MTKNHASISNYQLSVCLQDVIYNKIYNQIYYLKQNNCKHDSISIDFFLKRACFEFLALFITYIDSIIIVTIIISQALRGLQRTLH